MVNNFATNTVFWQKWIYIDNPNFLLVICASVMYMNAKRFPVLLGIWLKGKYLLSWHFLCIKEQKRLRFTQRSDCGQLIFMCRHKIHSERKHFTMKKNYWQVKQIALIKGKEWVKSARRYMPLLTKVYIHIETSILLFGNECVPFYFLKVENT